MIFPRLLCARIMILVLVLNGCATVPALRRPAPPVGTEKLSRLAQRVVPLTIDCPETASLGHQFLFIVLPFGSVTHGELQETVSQSVAVNLLLKGVRTFPRPHARGPGLIVRCEETTLSAYDYLVIRRVSSNVRLSASLYNDEGRLVAQEYGQGSYSRFREMPFEKELTFAFEQALDEAATAVISSLMGQHV